MVVSKKVGDDDAKHGEEQQEVSSHNQTVFYGQALSDESRILYHNDETPKHSFGQILLTVIENNERLTRSS